MGWLQKSRYRLPESHKWKRWMGGVSRIEWKPTRDQSEMIEAMAAFGMPNTAIAQVFGIDSATLVKHCKIRLERGAPLANYNVGKFLYTRASGQGPDEKANVTAAIFWARTRMKWVEKIINEHIGPNGQGIEITVNIPPDLTTLSERELADLYKRLAQGEELDKSNSPVVQSNGSLVVIDNEPFVSTPPQKPRVKRLSDV